MVLKFLEKSCAYVFDKNDFNFDYETHPAFDSGRPSNVCNEDDFDYAIELQEHDEYRDVATKTSVIAGFTEENIQKASQAAVELRKTKRGRRESLESIGSFGSNAKGLLRSCAADGARPEGGEGGAEESAEEEEDESDDDSSEEYSEEEGEDDDEFDAPPRNRKSMMRQLREKSFKRRMFLLSKRKRWVENHARR